MVLERRRIPLALMVALPALGLGLFGVWNNAKLYLDPCTQWGQGNPSVLTPSAACPSVSGIADTKLHYALAVVPFLLVILAGGLAVLVGLLRGRAAWSVAGAAILLVGGVPLALGGVGLLLCWISAALAMVATRLLDGYGDAATPAKAVGALAFLGIAYLVVAIAQGGGAFAFGVVVMLPLLAIAVAAWWPDAAARRPH